jgi:prepilin-type N-terminal cleavage/methylation domain-containing protein
MIQQPRKRKGFTLIELLVSMALTVFIMMILTQAFGTGMATFRTLRSVGSLQGDLRNAATLLKNDLEQNHFEGARRLSDPNFWQSPVKEGFFFVQGGMVIPEGTGTDGLTSAKSTTQMLHFARRVKGNRREQHSLAKVPASNPLQSNPLATNICQVTADAQFTDSLSAGSQWSEVAWFLVPKPGSSNLHSLYRAELLVIADDGFPSGTTFDPSLYPSFAIDGSKRLLTASRLASGSFGFNRGAANSFTNRATLVLDNVLSFRVQAIRASDADFVDVATNFSGGNLDSTTAGLSGSGNQPVKAIKVTIRVCDPGSELARQISLIQEL